MIDYNSLESKSKVKSAAKDETIEEIIEFYSNIYGAQNVSQIGAGEIVVCKGYRKDAFGNPREVCVSLKITTKDFEQRKIKDKVYPAFNRQATEEKYQAK